MGNSSDFLCLELEAEEGLISSFSRLHLARCSTHTGEDCDPLGSPTQKETEARQEMNTREGSQAYDGIFLTLLISVSHI